MCEQMVCVCVRERGWCVCVCAHRVKLGLWEVEMRALHNLRELCVQTHTEVQHTTINLHLSSSEVD